MTQVRFLDDLGRELDAAAGRIIRAERRSRRRALLLPVLAAAAAAALALVVWAAPEDPEREVSSKPPVTNDVRDLLAVLRRPENEADRSAPAREAREELTAEPGAAFRLVGLTEQGKGIVIAAPVRDGVCIYYPDIDGGGVNCWNAEQIAGGRAHGALGDQLHGLVPDGTERVKLTFTGGDEKTPPVKDNFFDVEASFTALESVTLLGAGGEEIAGFRPSDGSVQRVPEATFALADELAAAPDPPGDGRDVRASELRAAAQAVAGRVPYPPDMRDRHWWADDATHSWPEKEVQTAVEHHARCAWQRYWLMATEQADQPAADDAKRVLVAAARWPALRENRGEGARVVGMAESGAASAMARDVEERCRAIPGPAATPRR
jgi:hypothetical protein